MPFMAFVKVYPVIYRGVRRVVYRGGGGFFSPQRAQSTQRRRVSGIGEIFNAKTQGTSRERGSGFEHDDRMLRMNRMGRFEWMLSG